MGRRVISFGLNEKDLNRAIRELEECCGNPEWVDVCKLPQSEE